MQILHGALRWPNLIRAVDRNVNGGAVVIGAGLTSIFDFSQLTVTAGERLFYNIFIKAQKALTGGMNEIELVKIAGTAAILVGSTEQNFRQSGNILANGSYWVALNGLIFVSASGTLTMRVRGTSAGSNTTIAIGDGIFNVEVLRA